MIKTAKSQSIFHKHFNPAKFISDSFFEDVGEGDHTSLACIPEKAKGKAQLTVKENGILAGVFFAKDIFKAAGPGLKIQVLINDGAAVKKGDIAFHVTGNARAILKAERLVLNCMQRMSGIATLTFQMMKQCKGTKARVIDTRKTTPGFRALEKAAVVIGGGENHRYGLFDMILIKDNHVDYAGGIKKAINAANDYLAKKKKKLKIEIEARNMDEVKQVLSIGKVDRIMLDNFTPAEMEKAIKLINGKYETEASGGITLKNIRSYAQTGVDYISIGALTHSVKSLDLSLKATK